MKRTWLYFFLFLLGILSLFLGPVNLFGGSLDPSLMKTILWDLRFPRTLIAALIGGVLGLNGAVLQGFLRNPLADASLLGIGSGASLCAVLCLQTGCTFFGVSTIPFCAAAGGMGVGFFLYRLMGESPSPLRLILIGMALNSLFGALTSLILSISPDPYAFMQILFWLFGSYADVPLSQILLFLPFVMGGLILLWRLSPLLDALSFGENHAKIMGFSLKHSSWHLIMGVGLTAGMGVALCGVVGFIGLVTPHVMRWFFGSRPSQLLLPSFIGGAILSLTADILVRLIPSSMEIRVGVMTSLVGAPFFVYCLYRAHRAAL